MSESGLEGRLREEALRVTAPRLAVLAAVREHPHADTDALARVVRSRLGSVTTTTTSCAARAEAEIVNWGTCPDCLTSSSARELPREGIR